MEVGVGRVRERVGRSLGIDEDGGPVLLPAVELVVDPTHVGNTEFGSLGRVDGSPGDGIALEGRGAARVGRKGTQFGELSRRAEGG